MSDPVHTVHVLTIEHRHGDNISAHASHASALRHLHDYVTENWATEMATETQPAVPADAIAVYFGSMDTEFYHIDECEVLP